MSKGRKHPFTPTEDYVPMSEFLYDRLVCQAQRFNINALIPAQYLQMFSAEPEVALIQTTEGLLMSMVQVIHTMKEQTEIRVADGWWQHFKEEKFPAWLLKRFPIKYKALVIESEFMYTGNEQPDDPYKDVFVLIRRRPSVN